MSSSNIELMVPLIVATMSSQTIAYYAWRRRQITGMVNFTILLLAVSIWTFGYAMELLAPTVAMKGIWAKFQYLAIPFIPVAWFCFSLEFAGYGHLLKDWRRHPVWIVPIATLCIVWTNQFHMVYWGGMHLDPSGHFLVLELSEPSWFWVHTGYSYVLLLLGFGLVILSYARVSPVFKGQSVILIGSTVPPWIANIMFITHLNPWPYIDLTPYAFTLTAVIMAVGLTKFRLLQSIPTARDKVLDHIMDEVIVLDTLDRIVDMNKAARELFETKGADPMGSDTDEGGSDARAVVDRVKAQGTDAVEIDLVLAGEKRYFEAMVTGIGEEMASAGSVIILREITSRKKAEARLERAKEELEGNVRDRTKELARTIRDLEVEIRERKQAEDALKVSEEKYKALVEDIDDIIYTISESGEISYISPALGRLIGDTVDDAIGLDFQEFIHPDDIEVVLDSFTTILQGETASLEFRIVPVKGRVHWVRSVAKPVYRDDKVVGIHGIMSDITAQKEAEREIVKLTQLQERIIENANIWIAVLDDDDRILVWNSAAEVMSGYKKEDVVGHGRVWSLMYPDKAYRTRIFDAYRKNVKEGRGVLDYETNVTTRDNKEKAISWNASKIYDVEGNEFGGIIIGRDETDKKEAEAELERHKEHLEEMVEERTKRLQETNEMLSRLMVQANKLADEADVANKTKSEFLANMSHEIRTPMTAVIGMTDLFGSTSLTTDQKEYISVIRSSAKSLLTLINDILDLSKIEAKRMELSTVDFVIERELRNMAEVMTFKAKEKGLSMELRYDDGIPDVLIGDPLRLNQVLINLVGNAIKFTDKGGVILEVRDNGKPAPNAREVRFSIVDTGPGIPRDKLERIFDAFQQIDSSVVKKFGGTGLGLTISQALVNMMGGELWVDSVEGEGSSFHFTASFLVSDKRPEHVGQYSQPAGDVDIMRTIRSDAKVLVVEDNDTNRMLIRKFLEAAEIIADEAVNGAEAVKMARKKDYDIILMDIQMPEMDGIEATRRIRALGPDYRKVPIIALTAYAMRGDRERFLKEGMDDYISKPLSPKQFYETLGRFITMDGSPRAVKGAEHAAREIEEEGIDHAYLDVPDLRERLGEDCALLPKLFRMYTLEYPDKVPLIRKAIERKDPEALKTAAHALKGSSLNLGAKKAAELCLALETAGRDGKFSGTDAVLVDLVEALRRTMENMELFIELNAEGKKDGKGMGAGPAAEDP